MNEVSLKIISFFCKPGVTKMIAKYEIDEDQMILGGTSKVYLNRDMGVVLKYINSELKLNLTNEINALKYCENKMSNIHLKHIPKVVEYTKDVIVMEYKGVDAVEIINDGKLTPAIVTKFINDITSVITAMHDSNLCHGDIKLENVTYDSENNRWSLIDFGFATNADFPYVLSKQRGTYPYTLPACGNYKYMSEFKNSNPTLSIRIANDWYATAVTILGMVGLSYSENPNSVFLELDDIVVYYQCENKVLSALAAVILSVVDETAKSVHWCRASRNCIFINPGHRKIKVCKDIFVCWHQYIIELRKLNDSN